MSESAGSPPSKLLIVGMALLFVIGIGSALAVSKGSEGAYEILILLFYGGIGFFGALGFLYFFGGFIVYLARLGQEYRQEGLYHMLHGVRILFYVLCAVLILKLLE